MFDDKSGQGATEYLLILSAVLVISASAVYYVTQVGGFPLVGATAVTEGDEVRIHVQTGSIPPGEWEVLVEDEDGNDAFVTDGLEPREVEDEATDSWRKGNTELAPPYVVLGEYTGGDEATFYVSLRHGDSGHVYFTQSVTLS